MNASTREQLLTDLKRFLEELRQYRETIHSLGIVTMYGLDLSAAGERQKEVEEMRERLLRAVPRVRSVTAKYGIRVDFRPPFSNYIIRDYDVFSAALSTTVPHSGSVFIEIDKAMEVVNITIGSLESAELPSPEAAPLAAKRDRAKAFIAHGPATEALNKLCDFLDELGVKPLVVERLPSEGRSVNENVEYYLNEADCGVVLATKDDLVDGRFQPRANVNIEIGRFQERFGERIIYLLEEGAAFPTNISEKVWARFSQSSMDEAFLKVVRELKAFALL